MRYATIGCVFVATLALCCSAASAGGGPDRALAQRLRNLRNRAKGTITGEGHCWHLAWKMDEFLREYRKSRDESWLAAGVRYFDALIEVLHTSPDGYKGWVGPYIYDPKYYCDVHVTDSILIHHMLEFSELVLRGDDKTLMEKYAEEARGYVELAKKHLIEKYDARGTWREDGPYGGYVSWNRFMTPDDLTEWRELPGKKGGLSLPFNKQMDMAAVCLSLYRITGERRYRDKAEKVYAFFKSRLCLFGDHYVWNYWEPLGPWDRDTSDAAKPHTWHHWINTHPYRDYQAGEIANVVDAYHTGVIFDETDLRRLCATNLLMHNGDGRRPGPKWLNSNYEVYTAAHGRPPRLKAPGGGFTKTAGTLWGALTPFSAELARLAGKTVSPSFRRRHEGLPVSVFDRPFSSCPYLAMAAVMPSVVSRGRSSLVASKSRVPAPLAVELYDERGESRIAEIFSGETTGGADGREGILIVEWDGGDAKPGRYRVRWTIKGEYREFPVVVR